MGKVYTIYLTTECNFQCTYCYEEYTKCLILDKEMLKDILDFIIDLESNKDSDAFAVNFMGGEPLLKKELIYQAVNYIKEKCKKKVLYYITTNGSLLNEEMISWMKENDFFVRISIDGNKETHKKNRLQKDGNSAYATIMQNLKFIKKSGLKYTIRMTVANNTLDQIYDNVIYFQTLGFDKLSIVLDINMQFGKTEEDIFRKQMKKIASYYLNTVDDNPNLSIDLINGKMFGLLTESDKGFTMCGAGLTSFCIMPDGNIYPCAYVTNDEAFKIGNIKNGIDIELAQNLPRELFRKEFRDCLECTVKNMCHSMKCGYMNYIKSGFINVPAEIICRQEKLIYPILKDVLYELGKKNILIRQKILGKQVELIERDEKLGELGLKRLNHKFCGISDSSRSSVGSYRIASERNIRHQDIRIPVCEES